MRKIAIIYWSGTGNTEAMARLVAQGVTDAGGQAELFAAAQFSPQQAGDYDALAFGCPSMGVETLEESEFEPMFQSVRPGLGGRTIGLFGSYGWGDGEWMRSWAEDCEAAGAQLADEPVIACGAPEGDAAEACISLGRTLAG